MTKSINIAYAEAETHREASKGEPVDIKCLRTFQAVVACGTYAKAADQLGYTQSTVTVHIKQLERDLGLPLFERIGRRMVLTQKGAEALAQAAEIIAAADRLAALGAEETALRGTLRVDMAETLLCYAMDEVIAAFRERAPGVALRLRDRTCAQVSENLREGSCDLGLTYAFDRQPDDFAIEKVGQVRIALVAAPNAPLPDLQTARLAAPLPFIIDEPDDVFRIAFEQTLHARGVAIAETMELWSSQAIKRLVGLGMGFSLFPRFAVADELARGTFAEIPDPFGEQNFPIYLGHRKTHWLTPAARLFCDLVREHLASDNEKAAASG